MVEINVKSPTNSAHFIVGQEESTSFPYENQEAIRLLEQTRDNINNESHQFDEQLRSDHFEEEDQYDQGHDDNAPYEPYDQDKVDEEQFSKQSDRPQEPEYDENGEVQKKPAKRRKKSKDRRFDDLTRNYHMEREEKEDLQRKNLEMLEQIEKSRAYEIEAERLSIENRAMALKLEQREIQERLNKVSDLMIQAEQENDLEAKREGAKLLAKLTARESHNERVFEDIQSRYQEITQKPVRDPNLERLNERIREIYYEQSDPRDLESDYYPSFLKKTPWFDPKNTKEYDSDLSQEMMSVKKKFNRSLKLSGESDYIGTKDYYDDLYDRFQEKMEEEEVLPRQNKRGGSVKRSSRSASYDTQYYDQGYDDSRDDDYDNGDENMKEYTTFIDSNEHERYMRDDGQNNINFSDPNHSRNSGRPVVDRLGPQPRSNRDERQYIPKDRMPLPRSNPNLSPGNRSRVEGSRMAPENLPNLTRAEYDVAIRSQMPDPRDPRRKLNADERVMQWRREKAAQNWQRGLR